jgi:hypothetical protein
MGTMHQLIRSWRDCSSPHSRQSRLPISQRAGDILSSQMRQFVVMSSPYSARDQKHTRADTGSGHRLPAKGLPPRKRLWACLRKSSRTPIAIPSIWLSGLVKRRPQRKIVGGNEWVVLVAMFENLIGLFQLFCVLCCWDKVTDGHDVVPF